MLPVHTYLSREDVDVGLLERLSHSTICPYQGISSDWSVKVAGTRNEIVVHHKDPSDPPSKETSAPKPSD